jgi:hypothetical protein
MSISSSSRPSTPRIMREGSRSRRQCIRTPHRLHTHRHLLTCLIRRVYYRALRRSTSMMSSSTAAGARIVASPLSATVKGAATSREILNLLHQHERRPRCVLCDPLALQRALGGVWRLHHISGWWPGRANFGPTCRRSTTGWSSPPNFYRSTTPPSLLQEEMRPSWPTISRLP